MAGSFWPRTCATGHSKFRSARKKTSTSSSPSRAAPAEAFAAGINYYLETHPQTKPRLLKRIEPWYLLAFARGATLELVGGHMHVSTGEVPNSYEEQQAERRNPRGLGQQRLGHRRQPHQKRASRCC